MRRADVHVLDIILGFPWLGRSICPSAGLSPQPPSVRFLFVTRELEEGKFRFSLLVLHQIVIKTTHCIQHVAGASLLDALEGRTYSIGDLYRQLYLNILGHRQYATQFIK